MALRRSKFLKALLFQMLCALALFSCKTDETIAHDDQPSDGLVFEVAWVKTFGGSGEEDANSIAATPDGGYIVLGYTQSSDGDITDKTTSDSDLWVLKLTSEGLVSWSKTYGGSEDERGTAIIPTNDGGYLLSAYTRSSDGDISENAGFYDYWLVKLNASGDLQWEKTFGYAGNDQANSVIQTADGGYLMAGFLDVTASGGQGNEGGRSLRHGVGEFWAIKTDSNGNFLWSRYFGGTDNDRAYAVIEADNGDLIMVGNTESDDFDIVNPRGSYDFWAVRITSEGEPVWAKNYGGSGAEIAYDIFKSQDGNYLITGDTRSNDQDVTNALGNADAWLIKIDNNGQLLWQKNHGGSQFDTGRAVTELNNSSIFVSGTSRSDDFHVGGNNGQSDFWLYATNPSGELFWEQNIGGSGLEFANDHLLTNNNEILIVGSTESSDFDVPLNRGSKDVMIVKLKIERL